jgi:type II secretory pathway component GspD/PulD (secretin)
MEVVFKKVGTKLAVTPKIRGDYIEVSLTPQISYLSEGRRDVISIKELATTVMVANGQSINIGGLIKDEEFSEYFFKTDTASKLDIILTPRIQ